MDMQQFEGRKKAHIQLALDPANQAGGRGGLDTIHLVHEALPDLDLNEVQLQSQILKRFSKTPYFVAGITAGHALAPQINRTLAEACQERGWAMGVGSQRRDLEAFQAGLGTSSVEVDHWRLLRKDVPRLALFANIGISQLVTASLDDLKRLVDSVEAQALVIHANALQEAIQTEGTPQFKNSTAALKKVCSELGVPVVLKETGCGFSHATLRRLRDFGLAAIDVSGMGGTHWGRIEGARAHPESIFAITSRTFANWGELTVDAVRAARSELSSSTEIWASGGVRTGLDAAKLIALGAHQVGFAKPALEAALEGPEALRKWMEAREYELKVALFCTGTKTPQALREKEGVWTTAAV